MLRQARRAAAETDPARLLDDLLRHAIELLGGSAGIVTRWDDEDKALAAVGASSGSPDRVFTDEDAALLEMLASTAVSALVALEQARLDGVLLAARTAQHELNNQLAIARSYADMLASAPDLPPRLTATTIDLAKSQD